MMGSIIFQTDRTTTRGISSIYPASWIYTSLKLGRDHSCNCGSSNRSISYLLTEESGPYDLICDAKNSSTLLDLFSWDLNAHPSSLSNSELINLKDSIDQKCAKMMYEWHRERDFFKFWTYLYINWYKPE